MCALLCCCYSTNITPPVQNCNQNVVQCTCSNCTRKKGCTVSQQPFRMQHTTCCCYTCSLIRFLLLSTLASPALGVELLHYVLRSHAWWAYLDLVAQGQPFLHGLHPHVLRRVRCLLGSCHTSSLCCGHPPLLQCKGGFGANARSRTGMPSWRGILSPLCLPIPPRSQKWPARRDSNP